VFNLGAPEIMVILLLALIVLGPDKLPEAAKSIGRFTSEVRRMSNGFRSEVKAAFDAEEAKAKAEPRPGMQGGGADDDAIEAEARARGNALVAGSAEHPAQPGEPDAGAVDPADPADPTDEP
jgi:Tat protein translocase TatB subunit